MMTDKDFFVLYAVDELCGEHEAQGLLEDIFDDLFPNETEEYNIKE